MMEPCRPLKRAFTTSSTQSGGFASKVPTTTEPDGDGVHTLTGEGGNGLVPCAVNVLPFGTDAANEVFALRVIGWRRALGGLWVPTILAELTCTLGASTGVAGEAAINTDFFCDTLAIVSEPVKRDGELTPSSDAEAFTSKGTVVYSSPAGDLVAFARVPLHGVEKIEFAVNVSTAASGNALFSLGD